MDLSSLLGPRERGVMDVLWAIERGTVRDVVGRLRAHESLAYTTVMTIMNNLVHKGVLTRKPHGKAYVYEPALTREAFVDQKSAEAVSRVLAQFGDLAIPHFLKALAGLPPGELERLRQLVYGQDKEQHEA